MNNKYFLFSLVILLLTLSCNKNNSEVPKNREHTTVKYLNIINHGIGVEIDTLEFSYSTRHNNGKHEFIYQNEKLTTTYYVDFECEECTIVMDNDTNKLDFLKKRNYVLYPQKDSINVYCFIRNPHITDGSSYHYISPTLGVILRKSTTWPEVLELFDYYDHTKNGLIKVLTTIIYNDPGFTYTDAYLNYKPTYPPKL